MEYDTDITTECPGNKFPGTKFDFEFMWWVRNTQFFQGTLTKLLEDIGVESGMAFVIARSDSAKEADVVKFTFEQLMPDEGLTERFWKECRRKYLEILSTKSP